MAIFKIENEFNNQLTLTQNEDKWQVVSVTGLNPPSANISTSVIPSLDGTRFNSSRLEQRNIVITLAINGDPEINRNTLNSVIFSKRYLRTYYKNKTKDVYIDGYVESVEYDVFENKMMMQISVICPFPFWRDLKTSTTILSPIIDLLEWPISLPLEGIALSETITDVKAFINNAGSAVTGVQMDFEAAGAVTNPFVQNLTTGALMQINVEMAADDVISVNTIRGRKSIVLYSGMTTKNIINDLDSESDWLTLNIGNNTLICGADYGVEYLRVKVYAQNLYGGV